MNQLTALVIVAALAAGPTAVALSTEKEGGSTSVPPATSYPETLMRPVERPSGRPGSNLVGLLRLGGQTIEIQETDSGYNFTLGSHVLASDIESNATAFQYVALSSQGRNYVVLRMVGAYQQSGQRCSSTFRVMMERGGIAVMSSQFGTCQTFRRAHVDDRGVLRVTLELDGMQTREYAFAADKLQWNTIR